VVTTHEWSDRVETVEQAKAAGMEACCGGIIGLGEARADWVDLALALREIGVESVPVNFLNPRSGTPLEDVDTVRPQDCLKALAMFRLVHPEADIRMAGGREVVLDQMQPLALYAANSFFTDGYLTTGGQGESKDYRMIQQAGFEPVIVEDGPERQTPATADDTPSGDPRLPTGGASPRPVLPVDCLCDRPKRRARRVCTSSPPPPATGLTRPARTTKQAPHRAVPAPAPTTRLLRGGQPFASAMPCSGARAGRGPPARSR
jgi:Biotin synthase and related enzymes